MSVYLTDASIWIGARRRRESYLQALLAERVEAGEVATCVPVALEVLAGAEDAAALEADWDRIWRHLRWLVVDERVLARSIGLLRELAATTRGAHRRGPLDYVVAACAEASTDVVLWHWDRDLTAICDFAGIGHEAEHDRARDHGIGLEPGETIG